MDFGDENIGKCSRNKFETSNQCNKNNFIKMQLTPIELATYTIKRWKPPKLIVQRTQFPMVAAKGIHKIFINFIHKSQGSTMDKVVVHVNQTVRT